MGAPVLVGLDFSGEEVETYIPTPALLLAVLEEGLPARHASLAGTAYLCLSQDNRRALCTLCGSAAVVAVWTVAVCCRIAVPQLKGRVCFSPEKLLMISEGSALIM